MLKSELAECCFTSTETVGLLETGAQDGHLDSHTASELCQVQCCITSTETVRTIRDGEPRTATSTFIHTAPELCLSVPGLLN